MILRKFTWLPVLLLCGQLYGQVKTVPAIKTDKAPKVDGHLDEGLWANAPVTNGFTQNYPDVGKPASQETTIKILYDDAAIYIGAHLHDDPSLIRKQITARDEEQRKDVDFFAVFFDTYDDNQNGFQFVVTSANVQSDARLGSNLGSNGGFGELGDKTWDAVWSSAVQIQKDGWTVEMRIPYISLRFAKKDLQNWGLQFSRLIRRTNETCYWSNVDPSINGFVNQFGELNGLKNLQPPLRLSFSPYISTGYRSSPAVGNGFDKNWLRSGGMDVKYGVNESFTLDATLIPDFGQVISDNVVNNLSPFEIRFTENRPFFTEGTEIFNKANLFYSRRVGDVPSGFRRVSNFVAANTDWDIVKNPSVTQLYNATKFSGRTSNKLGIGIFNAITAPMEAKIRNKVSGKDSIIQTAPLANYNIVVLDQALKGRSSVTFTNTNVMRSGGARDANVTAVDVALFNEKNTHALNGTVRYSKIWGADEYDGYNTTLRYGKVSGNWQYNVSGNVESKRYDPNDLGILFAANEVTYRGNISYRQFQPTKNFLTYSYSITPRLQYLYKPYAFSRFDVTTSAFWVFKNFWDITFRTNTTPGYTRDYFELRTDGKYLRYPTNYVFELNGSSDSRKKLFLSFGGVYAVAPKFDNVYSGLDVGVRYRFSNRFTLDLQTNSSYETNQLGYAFLRESNGDPIAGFRNNRTFASILSGIYNFTPRINLTLRTRHYWNKVNYTNFFNVNTTGDIVNRTFIPGQDDNYNAFNIDAFFTWDFRLGSRLIVGYKNWLGDQEVVTLNGKNNYFKNLGGLFNLRHGNEVTVRFIYFLDYNQLRKKR
jgi:hypothetical protein